ncbi:MAG: right-handed parallel beta-helix repeat-containing protein, partial [Candidatus Solibacter sp.]
NRPGWASGNAMTVLSKPGRPTTGGAICAYEDCDATYHTQIAKLVITYPLGNPHIYQSSVTWSPNQVYRNDAVLIEKANLGALTADGQWYYDSGAQLLYIYSTNNPSSDTIEATRRNNVVLVSSNGYLTLAGLHVIKSNVNNLGLVSASYVTISNSEFDHSSGSGVSIGSGSYNVLFDGGSVHNNGSGGGDGDGIGIGNSADASHDIAIQNMDIYANGNATMGNNISIGITDTGQSPYNILIQRNIIRDATYFCGILDSASAATVVISHNTIVNNAYCGVQAYNTTATTAMTVELYNNTIVGNRVYGLSGAGILGTTTITAKNNIIWNNASGAYAEYGWDTSHAGTLTMLSDYNHVHHTNGNYAFLYGSTGMTLAGWHSTTGQDTKSITSDPLFTNAGAGDFTLQSGSPAINAGVCISGVTPCPTNIGAK